MSTQTREIRISCLWLALATVFAGHAAATQQWVILHDFSADQVTQPQATLVEITPGVFLGSYVSGLFQVTPSGAFGVFDSFFHSAFGAANPGAVTPSSNGYFYGVASTGENASSVYRITSSGQRTIINDSLTAASPLAEGFDGNLWGTQGSASSGYSIFKMSLSGSLTTVASGLNGPTEGPLVQASDGNFYGATDVLASTDSGQIYRVTPGGQLTVLYTFPPGEGSYGGLIEATNGLLYGTSVYPYQVCPAPAGSVFSISLSGSFKTILAIPACYPPGGGPFAGLLEASNGLLYGSTALAGTYNAGNIFAISLEGGSFQNVAAFDVSDGAAPGTQGPALTQGSDGSLYGTTTSGGSGGGGTVFQFNLGLTPPLPRIRLAQPSSGAVGTTIRLTGNYLLNLTGVSFNGTPATFTPINVNYAEAVVPSGATSGPITVTTMNGSITTKSNFTVK
jgi:uncharacterized repeat protein (TIGR03803 family)